MNPDEFKKLYVGEFPSEPPAVVAVNSFSSACYAANERNLNRRQHMRYLHCREQVLALTSDWKNAPDAPRLLCIHYDLWDLAKERGIVAD